MRLNKQQKLLIFSLGLLQKNVEDYFKEKPLDAEFSKSAFIELVMNANIVDIKERALYKNLEALTENKMFFYRSKSLILSKRGEQIFKRLSREMAPFINVKESFDSRSNLLKLTNKAKTVLATD